MLLSQLPEDVLYHVWSYLDYKSLSRLSQVCKTIYHFINRDTVWRKIAKEFLNTGITRNGTDIYPSIPLKERVKIAQNWYDGVCKRAIPLKWKTKLLPWLQLDGDTLFLSQAADIGAYHLHKDSGRLQRNPYEIYSGHKGDVCRFVLTDSHLISGGSDGKILVHSRRSDMSVELSGHNQEVNCLDSKDRLIISGSRDRTARIWTLTSSCPRDTIPMYDRVWSVAISPTLRPSPWMYKENGRVSLLHKSPPRELMSNHCCSAHSPPHTVVTGAGESDARLTQKRSGKNKQREPWQVQVEELRDRSLKKHRLHTNLCCGIISVEYRYEGVKIVNRNFTVCKRCLKHVPYIKGDTSNKCKQESPA